MGGGVAVGNGRDDDKRAVLFKRLVARRSKIATAEPSGRRVAKLYVSKCYFLCRHCNRLVYASQYEQPWQRARRRANKLWQRLDSGITGALPEKRKGRSARTYERLLEKTLEAEILADEAWLKRLQWLAQIETDLK